MAKKRKSKKEKYPKGEFVKGTMVRMASKPAKTKDGTKYFPCTVKVKALGLKFETFAILWAKAYKSDPDAYTKGSKLQVEMLETDGNDIMLAKIGFTKAEGISVKDFKKALKASKR